VHRAAIELIKAPDLEAMLRMIYYNLREDFAVPHVSIRLWSETDHPPLAEFGPASQEARVFAESLNQPYCSRKPMFETGQWFGEAETIVKSFAYVPQRAAKMFGLLILASEDPQRFYPEMGTLYLKRLGELSAPDWADICKWPVQPFPRPRQRPLSSNIRTLPASCPSCARNGVCRATPPMRTRATCVHCSSWRARRLSRNCTFTRSAAS
jgi:hypothetical protein